MDGTKGALCPRNEIERLHLTQHGAKITLYVFRSLAAKTLTQRRQQLCLCSRRVQPLPQMCCRRVQHAELFAARVEQHQLVLQGCGLDGCVSNELIGHHGSEPQWVARAHGNLQAELWQSLVKRSRPDFPLFPMCGIALIVDAGGLPASAVALLEAMHRDLAPRGPDGEGWLVVDRDLRASRAAGSLGEAALSPAGIVAVAAFRRLAIRDTDVRANQPLQTARAGAWILFNGEVYNDRDLRAELRQRGVSFHTSSDAETVLAAYEEWGDRCFERIRGMWGLAIVDPVQGRMVLSRDRLGIKPLYLARAGGRLVVASHPRPVARAIGALTSPDPWRWHRFLRGLPSDDGLGSFFLGVAQLPAGALLSWALREGVPAGAVQRYWSPPVRVEPERASTAPSEDLTRLIRDAVSEHLVSDRPLGCTLSGGLDSSVISCVAAAELRRHGQTPQAFSLVYDDPRLSEWPFVQAVAAHAGIRAATHTFTSDEAWSLVDPVVHAQGEPLLGQDSLAHYRTFRLAREHGCAVVLEGQGADELFAGLPSYEAVMFKEWMQGGRWGRAWREAALRARIRGTSLRAQIGDYIIAPLWDGWRRRPVVPPWLEPAPAGPPAPVAGAAPRSTDPSMLHRFLFDLVFHTNIPAVLQMQDRNAMAHGVENRPPFLDHRVVEWAFRQPSEVKVGAGYRKRVLRDAATGIVPPIVLARTHKRAIMSRHDFMPLRTRHREALAEMAASPTLRTAPFIRGDRVSQFVNDFLAGRADDEMSVWRLYTGWRWLEQCRLD